MRTIRLLALITAVLFAIMAIYTSSLEPSIPALQLTFTEPAFRAILEQWQAAVIEGNAPSQVSDGTIPDAEWSGCDYQGRLIFARDGKLFRRDGVIDKELVDFNNLTPNPIPAPKWATEPLSPVRKMASNRAVHRTRTKPRVGDRKRCAKRSHGAVPPIERSIETAEPREQNNLEIG